MNINPTNLVGFLGPGLTAIAAILGVIGTWAARRASSRKDTAAQARELEIKAGAVDMTTTLFHEQAGILKNAMTFTESATIFQKESEARWAARVAEEEARNMRLRAELDSANATVATLKETIAFLNDTLTRTGEIAPSQHEGNTP